MPVRFTETLDALNTAFPSPSAARAHRDSLYWCKQLMMTADSEVQLLTYGLLVLSPAGNAIISPQILDCLIVSMKYLHDHSDANSRSEILSITKRLLKRLQNSAAPLQKSNLETNEVQVHEGEVILDSYESFNTSFYRFLKGELKSGVSYPRHIISLLTLQFLFQLTIEDQPFSKDRGLVEALISLAQDPFEDVRGAACALLRKLIDYDKSLIAETLSTTLLQNVGLLAIQTGRADHADAMGRLSALRSLCISASSVAQPNFVDVNLVQDAESLEQLTSEDRGVPLRPGCAIAIHGTLLGVSYRLQSLQSQDERISALGSVLLKACTNVWNQVKVQLCVDSPETAIEEEDDINEEGPKDLLAFSWRALRDSRYVHSLRTTRACF